MITIFGFSIFSDSIISDSLKRISDNFSRFKPSANSMKMTLLLRCKSSTQGVVSIGMGVWIVFPIDLKSKSN